MRRIALASLLLAAALTASAGGSAAAKYAGKWRLDLEASRNMPQRFASTVTNWQLEITQNGSTLSVDVTIDAKDGSKTEQQFTHELDGTPAAIELDVRTPDGMQKIPGTASAKLLDDGGIDLIENELKMGERSGKVTIREHWTLGKNGALLVHRNDAMPRAAFEYDLVFRRVD